MIVSFHPGYLGNGGMDSHRLGSRILVGGMQWKASVLFLLTFIMQD